MGVGRMEAQVFTNVEYRAVSGVFQNNYHQPPSPASECVLPPAPKAGDTHSPGGEGVVGSIFWKTPDIGLASYSIISLRMEGSITTSAPSHSGEPTIRLHNTLTSVLPYRLLNDFISLLREITGKASYSTLF